ncbi:MAG TPA: hypothetical protein VFK97_02780 [Candidatus Saccharimonadales bacterium]|nr:hypothetical protein [Candidatus Saccharimonadales bacterium]
MPPDQPQNPNPQFDFMLKDKGQAKRPLGLPNLSKPVKIGLAVVGVMIILLILSLALGGSRTKTTAINGVLARGAEIQRVTAEVQQLKLEDPGTQALAATVSTALSSDQAQLEQYIESNKGKVSPAQLAADINKSTDSQMQSAAQNNNLDQTYQAYLKQSLASYRSDIQSAYSSVGPTGKAILKNSFDGVNTLLSTPPL